MKNDTISRAAVLSALNGLTEIYLNNLPPTIYKTDAVEAVTALPPAQTEPAIPLSWIEGQIEWLKSLDNDFSILTAGQISAMVNKWKDERNEQSD